MRNDVYICFIFNRLRLPFSIIIIISYILSLMWYKTLANEVAVKEPNNLYLHFIFLVVWKAFNSIPLE